MLSKFAKNGERGGDTACKPHSLLYEARMAAAALQYQNH